jgi:hypothetical protein
MPEGRGQIFAHPLFIATPPVTIITRIYTGWDERRDRLSASELLFPVISSLQLSPHWVIPTSLLPVSCSSSAGREIFMMLHAQPSSFNLVWAVMTVILSAGTQYSVLSRWVEWRLFLFNPALFHPVHPSSEHVQPLSITI